MDQMDERILAIVDVEPPIRDPGLDVILQHRVEVTLIGGKQLVGKVHVGNLRDGSWDVLIEKCHRHQCPFDVSLPGRLQ